MPLGQRARGGPMSPRQPCGVSQGEEPHAPSCSKAAAPRRAGIQHGALEEQSGMARTLCHLPESVKSFLSEITNPGAFTTPLLKSTFHSSVSFHFQVHEIAIGITENIPLGSRHRTPLKPKHHHPSFPNTHAGAILYYLYTH